MRSKIFGISLFIIFTVFLGCLTPKKEVKPIQKVEEIKETITVEKSVEKKDPDLALLESIEDGRKLPSSSGWGPEKYSEFNDQSFLNYEPANQPIDPAKVDYPLLNAALFYMASKERRELGLRPFVYSEKCEQAAFGHAQDMVKYDFYSHTSKVGGKETLKDRLDLVGIENTVGGENIIISFVIQYQAGRPVFTPAQNGGNFFSYTKGGTPISYHTYLSLAKSLVASWFNSPSHRKNILNPDYSYMGGGAYFYKDSKFFDIDRVKAVQVFSSKP
ncbi:MAG: CAP domain-containing protein [Leptospira sp.]|nr:CAP domain-containing protein [Leptospira sp.]